LEKFGKIGIKLD